MTFLAPIRELKSLKPPLQNLKTQTQRITTEIDSFQTETCEAINVKEHLNGHFDELPKPRLRVRKPGAQFLMGSTLLLVLLP